MWSAVGSEPWAESKTSIWRSLPTVHPPTDRGRGIVPARKETSQRSLDSSKLEVIDSAHLMRTLLRSVLLLLVASAAASAQAVSTAQINGNVKDSGGLPLPGVTVT